MAGGPVGDAGLVVAHGEIIGDRDRLVVRDEEAILRARGRAPRPHAGVGPGLQQIGAGPGADRLQAAVVGQPFLVGAPAEFRRLHAFGEEALDTPRVDEGIHRLGMSRPLGVALGDVNPLHAQVAHHPGPARLIAGSRRGRRAAQVAGEIHERLLDEPRHHAGIGPAAGHGRRAPRMPGLLLADRGPQSVVGAGLRPGAAIEIEARPGLDHGVDIERSEFAAEPHDVERRGIDREVHAEALAAAGE